MTKLTFDVDFNKDPEEILRDIQERAKAEVAKRESKEKTKFYLTSLHKRVNEDLGTKYASINDLIRALTSYANPKGRAKVAISPTGRRVTISMNKEIFDEIKSLLAQPNPNKAAIARQTGVSVVQVRKVEKGGFDKKFGGDSAPSSSPAPSKPKLSSEPVSSKIEEKAADTVLDLPPVPEAIPASSPSNSSSETEPEKPLSPLPSPSLDLPPLPNDPQTDAIDAADEAILPPPSLEEVADEAPAPLAPPPSPSLPEAPTAPEPPQTEVSATSDDALLPPPSFGEDDADIPTPLAPPPAPTMELPPMPAAPPGPEPPQPEADDSLLPPPLFWRRSIRHTHRSCPSSRSIS